MDSDDVPLIRKSIWLTALLIVLTAAVVRLADTRPQPQLLSQTLPNSFRVIIFHWKPTAKRAKHVPASGTEPLPNLPEK